ncbi:MAG: PIN domain-containing protein [Brasilonema octagenarum HA4186-MV1]|jgi:predicted nucleic acid-binding protein|uniref:PIN domain-containing protein n=1 Tax=Brasilonema octagenarum UFV-OR1 TaxID=417115 RepID=A0ABX1ML60_9CYAN|nr:PIN domain-containing protein [Brasilonema octagenarum]MBW4624970.1 PIN domain-containing protein [Brasilonema octagenarum HA4186-MV1]NMF67559.1 PIN domain-containing protein [Brasilonema octagenarum UFV-OR1]
MRVLIDTNVVLDFLQEREPFVEDAARLFEKIDAGEVKGFIAATTITNIYYIVRKAAGAIVAQDAIAQILTDLHICAVDRDVLEQAITLNFQDFEDAVQCACGIAHAVDAIVTRDASGFVSAEIPVMSPGELGKVL